MSEPMEFSTVPANEWVSMRVCAQPRLSNTVPNRAPNTVWKKLWLCCGLLLSVFSARAEAPTPPREFWDYLMEFSDDSGDVFDPADLAVIEKVKEKIPAGNVSEHQPANTSAGPAVEKSAAAGEPKAVERTVQ